MSIYTIPQKFWSDPRLQIWPAQGELRAVLLRVNSGTKPPVISWETSHDYPPPGIPQKLLLVDGFLKPNTAGVGEVTVVQGNPIPRATKGAMEVSSGFLTVICLQPEAGAWMSTNRLVETGAGGKFRITYEDQPAGAGNPAEKRKDILLDLVGVTAISEAEAREL